jgi:transcription initiation factor TFIIE subunit alpha
LSRSFDVAGWVHSNHTEAFSAKAAAASSAPGGDLKIAGSGGNKTEDAGVGVLISTDKDEATRILERNAEAEMKRQQNALPTWHLKSTITGELTTLGLKEKEREETAQQQQLQLEMQQKQAADDALKGLGIVGQSSSTTMRMQSTPQVMVAPEEVKPVINQEADCIYFSFFPCFTLADTGVFSRL